MDYELMRIIDWIVIGIILIIPFGFPLSLYVFEHNQTKEEK